MKRHRALVSRKGLRRGRQLQSSELWTPLTRRARLKANRKRLRRLRLEQFGSAERQDWIKDRPCDTCGAWAPSVRSHYPSRGAGGLKDDQMSQCGACHDELHRGVDTFELAHGVDLLKIAARVAAEWARRQNEGDG